VENITVLTAPPISTIKVVVPNATLVSSTVGKETLDECHMTEVTPPSLPLTFHVVGRAPLASTFPQSSQLAAPLALDFAEIGDHVGVISEPNGHKVSVPSPRAFFWQWAERTATKSGNKIRRKPS
jgi:hypothetical protein